MAVIEYANLILLKYAHGYFRHHRYTEAIVCYTRIQRVIGTRKLRYIS